MNDTTRDGGRDDHRHFPEWQLTRVDGSTHHETWVAVVMVAVVALVAGLLGGVAIASEVNPPPAVCHAVSEAGDMLDCEYHDGAWWPTEPRPVDVEARP